MRTTLSDVRASQAAFEGKCSLLEREASDRQAQIDSLQRQEAHVSSLLRTTDAELLQVRAPRASELLEFEFSPSSSRVFFSVFFCFCSLSFFP
jgi:hypothetical protein